jgi:predicted transcriptional regulator
MDLLNEILQELGISKVKLAKYLNVSRQMVYNYLTLDSIDKWPKEKKVLLLQLLNINDGSEETLKSVKVTTEYLMDVEKRLTSAIKSSGENEGYFDLKGLDKDSRNLLSDITFILKDKLSDEKSRENFALVKYVYYLLQSVDNVPEIKYILAYMAKNNCFIKMEEYAFNEEKQYIFEGILYSALALYNNGGASKSKLVEKHKNFERDVEQKKEETLTRTQQLTTLTNQALKELGYESFNESNSQEFLEKLAEIETRKV